MSANNETLATISRFVSIAVLSCLLITGGMWVYHNRAQIVDGDTSNKEPGNWFTRWAGIDATKLNDDYTRNIMSEHVKPFKSDFEFDRDWFQKMHGTVEFDWDSSNR